MIGVESDQVVARPGREPRAIFRLTATTMLTIYIVLLFLLPSNLTISILSSYGRPAQLWGLLLAFWWVNARLQRETVQVPPIRQPIRAATFMFIVVVLVSFAAAMLRGQPPDQVSPAISALIRLMSWTGVLLVAMDGIKQQDELVKIVRRLVIVGAALAGLGLAQFATGQTLLTWMGSIPGFTLEYGGVDIRGSFTRPSGTATHPLEYAVAIAGILPFTLVTATTGGFRRATGLRAYGWWIPVIMIAVSTLVAVSRSAILGLVVAVAASMPALPRIYRWAVAVGGAVTAMVVAAAVPGILGTIINLFVGSSDDPSTQSRADALARIPDFIQSSPLIGQGFGIFLPRYYIFDNQWALLTVEVGVLGALAFASIPATAMWTAVASARVSNEEYTEVLGRACAAAMATIATMFFFFDALSFPISAGMFFLMAGLGGAVRGIQIGQQSNEHRLSRIGVR